MTDNPNVVTKERLFGDVNRWRRFGEPAPATLDDPGMFGPDTLTWKMLLHPATSVFQFAFQQKLQLSNRAIAAGIRDADTIARKARAGTMNIFDVFDRGQRNSGIHAPMWFGDTPTAEKVAKHLMNIHRWVGGGVIDAGEPELGNYAANTDRESMWATITEMTSVLWLYETFAFRDGQAPHRLSDEDRDRFVAEQGKYIRLFPHVEEEIPTTYQELLDLYTEYEHYFAFSSTMDIYPPTGLAMRPIQEKSMLKNIHWTQFRVLKPLNTFMFKFDTAINGAFPEWAQEYLGLTAGDKRKAAKALTKQMPLIGKMQQPDKVGYYRRIMWGPDAMDLMSAAENLTAQSTGVPA
jgi:uncharacterized protein (DUF2236 family)